jgi:ubiquinone/menaquinone biosynthesis C-methylase UbiE
MHLAWWIGGAVMLLLVAALLYWQLELAEGVYFGSRVVVWLYDRFASKYDAVKQFNEHEEGWFLGQPLARALRGLDSALVLDVATGTGRLPLALFQDPGFAGRIVALDLSREMLRQAVAKTDAYRDRLTFMWQDATRLPFTDGVFDAVTCLEALEFLPDSHTTLYEMVRVLRPGGILLTTNRVGPGVRWMPGRTMERQEMIALLEDLSLEEVQVNVWQVDYDIVWARKRMPTATLQRAQLPPGRPATLPPLLRCPHCDAGRLSREDHGFVCIHCGSNYPIAEDGIIEMATRTGPSSALKET